MSAPLDVEKEDKLPVTDPKTVSNPLGQGNYVKTAGCIIIGDEVLNGKTKDTNSNFFAQYCFDLGIELKRIEVIADDEDEIVEAARRMTKIYDFVVTSGGIGPTHDDITYPSLAKAFDLPLEYDSETKRRMWELSSASRREELAKATPAQVEARNRMALFPTAKGGHGGDGQGGARSEVLFVNWDKWVPVVRLAGKLCIFPGIPSLFQQLLLGLTPYIPLPPASAKPFRHLIYTSKPESIIAPFLTELQVRVKKEGIRVGSYPFLQRGVHVSLIGHDVERVRELGQEVVKELEGKVVSEGQLGSEGSKM
ncbi:molybdopterin binding domain-containing protein [Tremella mesenterica]|uniref:Molybdopterin binding domain-containing protein n=1 Tax=Tremella mesenterica TaxID=5217 RepID=A0A4Q1BCI1_TREME|nr:molybdopterin binding domain-containing protein [Tremella mesenterica]